MLGLLVAKFVGITVRSFTKLIETGVVVHLLRVARTRATSLSLLLRLRRCRQPVESRIRNVPNIAARDDPARVHEQLRRLAEQGPLVRLLLRASDYSVSRGGLLHLAGTQIRLRVVRLLDVNEIIVLSRRRCLVHSKVVLSGGI